VSQNISLFYTNKCIIVTVNRIVLTVLTVTILLRKTFDLSVLVLQASVGKQCNCVKVSYSKGTTDQLLN